MTDKADLKALKQCMALAMASDERTAEQLTAKLQELSWFDVARSACYHVQHRSMKLRPNQEPPCVADEDDPYERDKGAQRVLKRLLQAGLSRYEPDPLAALEA